MWFRATVLLWVNCRNGLWVRGWSLRRAPDKILSSSKRFFRGYNGKWSAWKNGRQVCVAKKKMKLHDFGNLVCCFTDTCIFELVIFCSFWRNRCSTFYVLLRYSNHRNNRNYIFQKILTTGGRRPDFGVHKWDFGAQKRRFEMTKRRFCFDNSESRWKSADYKTAGFVVKNFDKLEEFSGHRPLSENAEYPEFSEQPDLSEGQ